MKIVGVDPFDFDNFRGGGQAGHDADGSGGDSGADFQGDPRFR